MDVVTELLARCGEAACLESLMWADLLTGEVDIPKMRIAVDDERQQAIILVDDEPRRLVMDMLFGWMWYNSEGPEE